MKRDIPVIAHRSVNHHLRLRAGTGSPRSCGRGGVGRRGREKRSEGRRGQEEVEEVLQ